MNKPKQEKYKRVLHPLARDQSRVRYLKKLMIGINIQTHNKQCLIYFYDHIFN